jgi:hypothetical protein
MSKFHLKKLLEYCPTGTAEGEIRIRSDVFVQFPEFIDLILPPAYSPLILLGQKGSGKSLLVDFSIDVLRAKKIPCVKLRPVDLNIDAIPDNASIAQAHREAYGVLVRACAVAMGETLSGFLSEDENKLRIEAISHGNQRPDLVASLAKLLPKVASKFVDVDIAALLPSQTSSTVKELSRALKSSLAPMGKGVRTVYVFIDDTDQVTSPEKPSHLNRIWGLLLACRDLAQSSEEIKCVITLRQEVWIRITNDKAGNRDQTDHFKTLLRQLDPNIDELRSIVRRRLNTAVKAANSPTFVDPYRTLFENHKPHMPGSEELTSWEDMIVTRSRGRPRDCIQLLNALASAALKSNSDKITEAHIKEVIGAFSESRVDFLCQENEAECPQLKSVIRAFAPKSIYDEGSFKISSAAVLRHISSIPSGFSLSLISQVLRPGNNSDAYILWNYLFRIGFLNARQARPGGRFLRVSPNENPNLATEANHNQLQTVTWEIHPAYRDFLIAEQGNLLQVRR